MHSVGDIMERLFTKSGIVYRHHCGDLYRGDERLSFIDDGLEGRVYRDGNTAVKIYHNYPEKNVLKRREIEKLSEVETERIILPDEAILGEGTRGYTMPFVDGDSDCIFDMDKDVLVREIDLIEDDLKVLGDEQVLIGDLRDSNYLSNSDNFYLIDSGDYEFVDCKCVESNLFAFHSFFLEDLFGLYLLDYGDISKGLESLNKIKNGFYNYNGGLAEYVDDYFSGSISEEVKKLVK